LCCVNRVDAPPSRRKSWMAVFVCLCEFLRRAFQMITCPECEAELTLPKGVMENELITCPECGTELEVISLNPVELALAPDVEEDWGE
jgi:alpha-aminoadipate carrier protein LysW